MPEDPLLKLAAIEIGLLGPQMTGLTLGYSIIISRGHNTIRLLSHQCRQLYQHETCDLIAAFLPILLERSATVGYDNAPFEMDARAHELST